MLKRTSLAAMRRTAPKLFWEKHLKADRHPYLMPLQYGRDSHPLAMPWSFRGLPTAIFLMIIYMIYDKFYGYSALSEHQHNRWNYGLMGKRKSYPSQGTAIGMNMPGFAAHDFERYERGATNLPTYSPIAADREWGLARGHHH